MINYKWFESKDKYYLDFKHIKKNTIYYSIPKCTIVKIQNHSSLENIMFILSIFNWKLLSVKHYLFRLKLSYFNKNIINKYMIESYLNLAIYHCMSNYYLKISLLISSFKEKRIDWYNLNCLYDFDCILPYFKLSN